MGKLYLGLEKTISVSLKHTSPEYSEELYAGLRDFLTDRGVEESTRRKSINYTFIEYDANDLTVTWKKLESDLEENFPIFKTEYSEGLEDEEEDNFTNDSEHLEIFM